jgi:predicted lipoprotein with Yx(FWY)xxD motif
MRSRILVAASPFILTAAIAACSSAGASTTPASVTPVSQAPVSQAPVSQAPVSQAPVSQAPVSQAPASAAGSTMTVEAKSVGAIGTVLVAGSNGFTVYTFSQDTKDSGKSACTGDCAVKWPPLTVAAGATPAGGTGVTGKLATITRDDGTLQVTYNGLPLYFFQGDSAAGDANGVYTNWAAVKP